MKYLSLICISSLVFSQLSAQTTAEEKIEEESGSLEEIVVSGTLREVSHLQSLVPVDIYRPGFFLKNPTSNIFEALQVVNGVRPQINCNVCNTGDIHINGLEGPYTMVLIDGMPIVSGLSTVYGLSGIPNALVERIEIVKGPASSLYGSEAIGGLINIITKNASKAPKFSSDIFSTSWGETNVDLSYSVSKKERFKVMTGINAFHYDTPMDNNKDNFTDLTLQKRVSVFQKWDFERKSQKKFTLAGRYYYEDRWGGEMDFQKKHRGGDQVYGEHIYTNRWELLGQYDVDSSIPLSASFSFNNHDQDAAYGDSFYLAQQRIGFGQLIHQDAYSNHQLLIGTALRYQYYNDNTTATPTADQYLMPSVFVQDEYQINEKHQVLVGARYDYHSKHGSIFTPRIAYRFQITDFDILRINAGTGFRVVNLFTEDHAALTGAREVIIAEALKPEQSKNINVNYLKKIYTDQGDVFSLEASAWYTYFSNAIIPDYETHVNQIIYANLNGYSESKGGSINANFALHSGWKGQLGFTLMDVSRKEDGARIRQLLTERNSGTWTLSYDFTTVPLRLDYTGFVYGPMRLPLLGDLDPRPAHSKTYSIQNIQATYQISKRLELYGGVKNLLNWTVAKGKPFLIANAADPFDKEVVFDNSGRPTATPNNPYALTFDPNYAYGGNQGIHAFTGFRYSVF